MCYGQAALQILAKSGSVIVSVLPYTRVTFREEKSLSVSLVDNVDAYSLVHAVCWYQSS